MDAANHDVDPERAQLAWLQRGVTARHGFQRAYGGDAVRLAADGPGFPRLSSWAALAGAATEDLAGDVCELAGLPAPGAVGGNQDNQGSSPPNGGFDGSRHG